MAHSEKLPDRPWQGLVAAAASLAEPVWQAAPSLAVPGPIPVPGAVEEEINDDELPRLYAESYGSVWEALLAYI